MTNSLADLVGQICSSVANQLSAIPVIGPIVGSIVDAVCQFISSILSSVGGTSGS